jgi:hypothetical protein
MRISSIVSTGDEDTAVEEVKISVAGGEGTTVGDRKSSVGELASDILGRMPFTRCTTIGRSLGSWALLASSNRHQKRFE